MNVPVLHQELFRIARLFPGDDKDKNDTSCSENDVDDQELFDDLSSRFATAVNKETGEVNHKETDEEAAIEDELIAAVVANAQSSSGGPTTEERETDDEHMNIVEVDCTADSQKNCRRTWRSDDGTKEWGC